MAELETVTFRCNACAKVFLREYQLILHRRMRGCTSLMPDDPMPETETDARPFLIREPP